MSTMSYCGFIAMVRRPNAGKSIVEQTAGAEDLHHLRVRATTRHRIVGSILKARIRRSTLIPPGPASEETAPLTAPDEQSGEPYVDVELVILSVAHR